MKLIELFKLVTSVALISDVWTSLTGISFICVTVHYVDSYWNLQKRIIAFRYFEHPHTAANISNAILGVADEFGFKNKIFSISLDNATNNDAAIRIMKQDILPVLNGQLFHVRCIAHIINLMVQDGLKDVEEIFSKIRDAFLFIRFSGARKQIFKSVCREHNMSYKSLQLNVQHRWNSTFEMLKLALEYKHPLNKFCRDNFTNGLVYEDEWKNIEALCGLLEKFNDLTELFSGSYYVTSNLVVTNLYEICKLLDEYRDNSTFLMICLSMEKKLVKYFGRIPLLFCFASIMDPRIKLNGLLYLIDCCKNLLVVENELVNYDREFITYSLQNLFPVYIEKYGTNIGSLPPPTVSTGKGKSIFAQIASGISGSSYAISNTIVNNELQQYLNSPILTNYSSNEETDNLDILSWWKKQQMFYPILSIMGLMARDLLISSVSTVASESAFSAGDRVLDERRSMLTPESLEMCVVLKDWIMQNDRINIIKDQDTASDEE